ncbi:Hypp8882 [Branchiostoma lanceolatum]|uniref:Hypp8882 protein n=1 Tax=Branchiostoma lanceolatum TaxID=7740 RepID=A0A8J9ZB16_BRALA|nr:Hypp8882 [Branchiostoma lanceolatum]
MKKRQALPLNVIEVFEFPETSSIDPPPRKALAINTWTGNKTAWSSFPTRGHNLTKGERNLIEGQCRNMHPKILEGLGEKKYSARHLPLEVHRKHSDRTLSRSPRSPVEERSDENGLTVPKTPELWSRMATARSEMSPRSSSAGSSWDWDSDTTMRGHSGRFSAMLVPADYPSRKNRPKSVHTPLCPCVKCRGERNPSQASVSDVGSAFEESLSEEPIGNVPGVNVVPEISVAPAAAARQNSDNTDTKH